MRGLTDQEHGMFLQLRNRLAAIPSAVVRCQLLMQMSQMVDMAYLGAYDREREQQLVAQLDDLGG